VPWSLGGKKRIYTLDTFCLNIADYRIRLVNESDSCRISPGDRFRGFLCSDDHCDLTIKVHTGVHPLPSEAEKVFDAPYVEEINGVRIKKNEKFWSVHKLRNDLFIRTSFPLSSGSKSALLKFSLTGSIWDLTIDGADGETDPLEYPLDGLILYYLTAIRGDIMIHASGVNNSGRGYIFSGISGQGKTTIARIWDNAGARVINDDRLIIRNTDKGWRMYNTPVYNGDVPRESAIDRIFLIGHGATNMITQLRGASAVSMALSNCIQHSWDKELVARLIGSLSFLCMAHPVFRLDFRPDRSVIDEILNNE
jgi:hypothetical protein